MGPLKRNQKTQLKLHFTKRNVIPPNASSQPSATSRDKPLRPMPRPTATPFFNRPMPKSPPKRHLCSVADDAWEAADRLMKGQRLTPKKHTFEDHAPVMQDSDDDFEPEVTQSGRKSGPSSARKSSSSVLRNDRSSMTKRSATKDRRPHVVGVIQTQQRSVFEDLGLPPKMHSLCSSDEGEDENHVVVFDGEKSSLSGTDNDDERGIDAIDLDGEIVDDVEPSLPEGNHSDVFLSPQRTQHQAGAVRQDEPIVDNEDVDIACSLPSQRNKDINESSVFEGYDLTSKITDPKESSKPPPSDLKGSTQRRRRSRITEISSSSDDDVPIAQLSYERVPKAVGLRKCSAGPKELTSTGSQRIRSDNNVRPLFGSDSEEFEKFDSVRLAEREHLEGPSRRSRALQESLVDGLVEKTSGRAPLSTTAERNESKDIARACLRENQSDPESSDVEFISTSKQGSRKDGRNCRTPRQMVRSQSQRVDDEFEKESGYKTPKRTPKRNRLQNSDTDERKKSISNYIATASPSSSPPSKRKKRRRLKRLVVASSSEDDDFEDSRELRSASGLPTNLTLGLEPTSETPTGKEWFHERDIGEFSESSRDTQPSQHRSSLSRPARRRTRRVANGLPSRKQPLPVKRRISESFGLSPDKTESIGNPLSRPPSQQTQRSDPPLSQKVTQNSIEPVDKVRTEVIDLVEDEKPGEAMFDYDECHDVHYSLSPGGGDEITSPASEDDAPPPFNLLALCSDGESIRQMKERLGEEFVMNKVTEAQESGREIVGGEELGLTNSYNKTVFDRFSKTVVAHQLSKKRTAKSVTEKALRGEYKFHYRGRQNDGNTDKRRGSAWRGKWSRGRFANYRKRRD